ncbi:MAG TPA: DUF1080 domain-containing protein [Ignavibacteria bacterium]|nr:DUF1080 domain-containing protein [Ignavibacteria bacterium]
MCERIRLFFSEIFKGKDTKETAGEAKLLPINKAEWTILSNGSGEIDFANGAVRLKPKAAILSSYSTDNEYGAWIISKVKVKNFKVDIEVNNRRQLRQNLQPRNFEVFWFFFNYLPQENLKKRTNYFIHKTTQGLEIGKAFDSYGQTFLSTPNFPDLQMNKWYKYTFIKNSQKLTINIDDKKVFEYNFANNESEKQLIDEVGHLGIYTEDAEIEVRKFGFIPL